MTKRIFKISGDKLARARGRVFLSQEQLAAAIGMSGRNVSRLEQSESAGVYINKIPRLAQALKMNEQQVLQELGVAEGPGKEGAVRSDDVVDLKVPAELAARIQEEAAAAGMTLVEYLTARHSPAPKPRNGDRGVKKGNTITVRTPKGVQRPGR